MRTVKFTAEEIKLLERFLWCNPCSVDCAIPKMQNKNDGCEACKLPEIVYSIEVKLGLTK
jgi:hypothetical protein